MKDDYAYHLFQLKNKEFTYTVDDTTLDCGLHGALYFVQMDADGGKSKYGNAGAELGLGYCDAQCPHDLKFINNEANMEDWKPSETDPNAGTGKYGSCCTEIDIWEGPAGARGRRTRSPSGRTWRRRLSRSTRRRGTAGSAARRPPCPGPPGRPGLLQRTARA